MSKVLIEVYRNHEIFFDTEENSFIGISDKYDRQFEKKSYSGAKKEIDDYIKDNLKFKPVWVETNGRRMFNGYKKVLLTGIRKDGKFTHEEKGKNVVFSERDYFISNDENDSIYKKIEDIEKEIETLEKRIGTLNKEIIKEDLGLKELKAKYSV